MRRGRFFSLTFSLSVHPGKALRRIPFAPTLLHLPLSLIVSFLLSLSAHPRQDPPEYSLRPNASPRPCLFSVSSLFLFLVSCYLHPLLSLPVSFLLSLSVRPGKALPEYSICAINLHSPREGSYKRIPSRLGAPLERPASKRVELNAPVIGKPLPLTLPAAPDLYRS